jgi:hypothetical protein
MAIGLPLPFDIRAALTRLHHALRQAAHEPTADPAWAGSAVGSQKRYSMIFMWRTRRGDGRGHALGHPVSIVQPISLVDSNNHQL